MSKRDVRLSLFRPLPVFHTVWLTDSKKERRRWNKRGEDDWLKAGSAPKGFLRGKPLCCSPVQTRSWHVETLKNRIQVTGPAWLAFSSTSTHTSLSFFSHADSWLFFKTSVPFSFPFFNSLKIDNRELNVKRNEKIFHKLHFLCA